MKIQFSIIAIGFALCGAFTACKDHNPSGSSTSDSTKPFMQPVSDSALPGNATGGSAGNTGGADTTKDKTGKDTANKKY